MCAGGNAANHPSTTSKRSSSVDAAPKRSRSCRISLPRTASNSTTSPANSRNGTPRKGHAPPARRRTPTRCTRPASSITIGVVRSPRASYGETLLDVSRFATRAKFRIAQVNDQLHRSVRGIMLRQRPGSRPCTVQRFLRAQAAAGRHEYGDSASDFTLRQWASHRQAGSPLQDWNRYDRSQMHERVIARQITGRFCSRSATEALVAGWFPLAGFAELARNSCPTASARSLSCNRSAKRLI